MGRILEEDAVLNEIGRWIGYLDEDMIARIKIGIKKLPMAQRWISCSERLPDGNGRYLVTRGLNACGSLWNRVYIVNYSDLMGLKTEKIWWGGNIADFEKYEDILAWMPLPESYLQNEGV